VLFAISTGQATENFKTANWLFGIALALEIWILTLANYCEINQPSYQ
jgi:hypothetical protein